MQYKLPTNIKAFPFQSVAEKVADEIQGNSLFPQALHYMVMKTTTGNYTPVFFGLYARNNAKWIKSFGFLVLP